jgi:hypothetical protein
MNGLQLYEPGCRKPTPAILMGCGGLSKVQRCRKSCIHHPSTLNPWTLTQALAWRAGYVTGPTFLFRCPLAAANVLSGQLSQGARGGCSIR